MLKVGLEYSLLHEWLKLTGFHVGKYWTHETFGNGRFISLEKKLTKQKSSPKKNEHQIKNRLGESG